MNYYEKKTKQGYHLFQSLQSAKLLANRIIKEPLPITIEKSVILDKENGNYYAELVFYQLSIKTSERSEPIIIIVDNLSFSDLKAYKKILQTISQKNQNKTKTKISTTTKSIERTQKNLEALFDD